MYLIDANVLITAKNTYYPLEHIPQFWEWLVVQGDAGRIKMPREIYEEVSGGSDDLADWIKGEDAKEALLLDEDADPALVQQALRDGYQSDDAKFTDSELIKVGRDAFLVAYGLVSSNRTVVTKEVTKRTKRLGATRLPDACDDCAVSWCDDFTMYRTLDFNLR
ncbi:MULTISPECIES: DUF4411 family protein [unclassified Ruegeria]|jgi:hypothetical protein|uniref:DUF4411 family protein n=1 Tax=unclassified Ruegeria TaxID=2625375 RepID=UPI00147E7970|nr:MULTISPECIES: DUF4411 family protein [unclassified Ruegeria]NOD90864.1 DUF4411 family protein [Ruegeria sp. HKCCD4318]NOE16037.1 DUF4411 family protein [Ruegeria sp. HKCCD4318-2]NOG11710.1 DUF4411 family protein [Ruegeria sp. HKCCD4315]